MVCCETSESSRRDCVIIIENELIFEAMAIIEFDD